MNNILMGDRIEVIYYGSKHFRKFFTVTKVGKKKLTVQIGGCPGLFFVQRNHAVVIKPEPDQGEEMDSSSEDGTVVVKPETDQGKYMDSISEDGSMVAVEEEMTVGLSAQMKNLAITDGTLIALDGNDKEDKILLLIICYEMQCINRCLNKY